MQTRIPYALSLAITLSSSLVLAGDFEGVIHMKSTHGGKEANVSESDWFIKGDNIRVERRPKNLDQADMGEKGAMMFNADKKVGYFLMPERKMYIEHLQTIHLRKPPNILKTSSMRSSGLAKWIPSPGTDVRSSRIEARRLGRFAVSPVPRKAWRTWERL